MEPHQLNSELENNNINWPEFVKELQNTDAENLYNQIFHEIKLGIGIFSLDGVLLQANEKLLDWLGYSTSEIVGKSIFEILSKSSIEKVKQNIRESSQAPYEVVVKNRSGIESWVEIYAVTIEIKGNKVRVAAFRDLSALKKIEIEQRESDHQYRLLFDNMNEAFSLNKVVLNENNEPIDFIYIDVNNSFEKITGLNKYNIINKRATEVIPEIEKYWIEVFGNVAITGIPETYSNYIKVWDRYFETRSYSPQKGYFAVVFSDITDRWKAEIELELHNKRLEILVRLSESKIDSLSDLLYLCLKETTFFVKCPFGFSLCIDSDKNTEITTFPKIESFSLSVKQLETIISNLENENEICHFYNTGDSLFDTLFKEQLINLGFTFDHLVCVSVKGKPNLQIIHFFGVSAGQLPNSLENHLVLLLESIQVIIEKQRYYEQIIKEKEKAEVNESRFFEIQRAGKIGWYEALLAENKFLGSYETYNIFFDEYYDYAITMEQLESAIHPEDRLHFFNTVKSNVELKSPEFEWEYRVITPKGVKNVYSKAFIKFDEQGNMVRRYGIVRDITEHKLTQIELLRHNERLESLFKIAQITDANASDLLKKAIQEALKLTSSDIGFVFSFHKETEKVNLVSFSETNLSKEIIYAFRDTAMHYRKKFLSDLLRSEKAYLDNGILENKQVINIVFGENTNYNNLMLVPISIDKIESLWIIVINKLHQYNDVDVKQITLLMDSVWKVIERQKYQEELIKAKERAEESDKLKSAFLANMSHEIRTPMNGIIGFSDLFVQENITPEKRKSYANIVIESGKQLLSIVDDILDFSKIEVGQINIFKKPVIVNDVITELFSFYSPRAKDNNISLFPYKDLPDNLSIVVTDKQRLVQILNNLLSNAFKFTSKGQISFGYVKKNEWLEFFVRDTGPGIPKNMQQAVFERFRQVESHTIQKFRGTGLGLSISQKLVYLLGGEIYLESEENTGTTFLFTIPYYSENDDIAKHQSEKKAVNEAEKEITTILIAEDEEINFMYLSELLSNSTTHILHAKNGFEAIDICKKHPEIGLVLMDVKMPELDGLQATRAIRDFRNQLPIVVQSAYVMDSDKEMAFLAGASGFISKPINKKQLTEIIDSILHAPDK